MTATAPDARALLTSAASADDVQALLAVEHLATLSAYTDDELALDLMRARRITGCAGMVDVLRTMIRATRKAAPPPLREAREPEGASLVDWLRAHDCPWIPDGDADIPAPYLLADDAVHRLTDDDVVMVAPGIIAVIGRAMDSETERVALDLVWRYHGRWVRRTVDRGSALTRDGVMALAAEGAPVDQGSATQVASWLLACDLALQVPTAKALTRLGWLPDGSGYAWGGTSIGDTVSVLAPGAGEREELARYHARGSRDGWVKGVWERVREEPAEVVVLASLAAPLLHVVGSTGWTLDVGGPRGSGKTTAQHAAASVWGGNLLVPWPRTWAGMRSTVEFRADVATVLDDTKNAASWSHVKDLLYQVAGERSQTLGSAGGGTRAGRLVRTIVISTGESPIAEHLQDAQGAAYRILTLGDRPFPANHRDHVVAVEMAAREHYGHLGPELVRWLHERREKWGALRNRFRSISDRIASAHKGDDAGRLAPRIALLELTQEIVRERLGLDSTGTALADFTGHAMGGVVERDAPGEALRHVVSHLTARPSQVIGWVKPEHAREPYLAQRDNGGDLHLVASELTGILEGAGYDPVEIRRQWQERGWLARVDKGRDGRPRTDTRASVGGHTTRVVIVAAAVVDAP